MHADLCALGFDGSYDAIARFAREWWRQQLELSKDASKHTYIPLQFKPGEAFSGSVLSANQQSAIEM